LKESFDALDGEQATLGEVEEQNNQHNIGGKKNTFFGQQSRNWASRSQITLGAQDIHI